ncbi:prolyl oligopeptidase family serine peptidase [Candidatus Palauibacter sp.]|uniref:prolyl oligopeptidase family serine peptidase n=1 Tax=Candidatus Palauibacter sp. TaxID=3101350 RepID=UPI003CC6BD09
MKSSRQRAAFSRRSLFFTFTSVVATVALAVSLVPATPLAAQERDPNHFGPADVFELEVAGDPRISPDGSQVVYARTFMDIMTDRERRNLWIVDYDGSNHRALLTGQQNFSSPRWSPDGTRLLYVASDEHGKSQLYLRWMDTGQTAMLTHLDQGPGGLSWSPDGRMIAFSMFVPDTPPPFASMPAKPEGATWAPPATTYERLFYRSDGRGFLPLGYSQVFVLPVEGGTPRQVTHGPYNHGGTPEWTPDSQHLLISATRRDDWEYVRDPEVFEVSVADGSIRQLTDRRGPDQSPKVSPDGGLIAYTGYDDRFLGNQVSKLYVMNRDGSGSRMLADDLDRSIGNLHWASDGQGLFFQYDTEGNTRLAHVDLDGTVTDIVSSVQGLSLGRPYGGGTFSASANDRFAYTYGTPDHPADLAVTNRGGDWQRLTHLNEDLFAQKAIGETEEVWYKSSHDGLDIQGWIVKPPGFDPSRKYPLVLEIHGGPFSNYGDRFSAEVQLYASAGYVVLYTNPRGSTSYGEDFANEIHHAYPSYDFDDLVSGVDEVISRGYVDEDQLFVTGGSGGGVLTAWIVSHTDRFAAAASQKPVINWYSWVLTADMGGTGGLNYWFPGAPWDNLDHYMDRSPIHHVANVTTPTMLITGEVDWRTPMSESEQFYQALKILKVPSVLVRIPEASHSIGARPSGLITKVEHILAWFERYRKDGTTTQ